MFIQKEQFFDGDGLVVDRAFGEFIDEGLVVHNILIVGMMG